MKRGILAIFIIIALTLLAAVAYAAFGSPGDFSEAVAALRFSEREQTAQAGSGVREEQEPGTAGPLAGTGTGNAENTAGDGGVPVQRTTGDNEAPGSNGTAGEPELRFMALGDIMLGRGVGARLQKAGGYEKAFEKIAPVLKQGDVVFANLESPFTASTHGLDGKKKIVLKAKPEAVSALTVSGINMVSLSNNHIMDYYEKGLFDTMSLLEEKNILFAGVGKNLEEARKPAIFEKNGIKVGLLAYTDMAELVFAGSPYLSFAAGPEKSGVVPRKYELIREDILKAREQVDLLAVSLHWGIEDSFKITPEQVEFARKLIDDGADMILGHHPHQFQGMEVYKGKPIFYSLGNFLFDQNDPENMESFIVDMKFRGRVLTELSAIPVRILNKTYVEIQTGEKAANILERQLELCRSLGAEPAEENDILVFDCGQG